MTDTDVEEFYGYAREVWRTWNHRAGWTGRIDKDDAVQAAAAHCWTIRNTYRPELASRRTYFTLCARRHITEIARQTCVRRRRGRTFSLDVRTPDGKRPMIEVMGSDDPVVRAQVADEARAAVDAMEQLPPRLWYILWQRIFHERTLRDIGGQLGISYERVRQLETSALQKLTRTLSRDRIQP